MGLLLIEQAFNGLQFGVMLFLIAAGLTLVFGIMDLVNLSHGSLVMVGAYLATTLIEWTGSFLLGILFALPATFLVGVVVEVLVWADGRLRMINFLVCMSLLMRVKLRPAVVLRSPV